MGDNEHMLLVNIKAGNNVSFTKLAELYSPLVSSLVSRYCSISGVDHDDLSQEASIALYDAAMSYKIEQTDVTFGLYAKICIRNRLISSLRHLKRQDTQEIGKGSHDCSPEDGILEKERIEELSRIVDGTLTPYERAVFKLYIEGKSYRETAELLGKTEKSIDNAVYRIKAKLKKLI